MVIMCSSRKNPYPPHGRSSEIPGGRGFLKVKILEAKYEAKLEFPEGTGGAKQETFRGGSMDIFLNCTIMLAGPHPCHLFEVRFESRRD